MVTGNIVECAEVMKKFHDFVIIRIKQKYSKVIMRLIHIFQEKKIDIQEMITTLCFDDVEKTSVFSTDTAFSTTRTEIQFFTTLPNIVKALMIINFLILQYKSLNVQKQSKNCLTILNYDKILS